MDFNGRSRSAGVHPHRRCRGVPRGRLWRRLRGGGWHGGGWCGGGGCFGGVAGGSPAAAGAYRLGSAGRVATAATVVTDMRRFTPRLCIRSGVCRASLQHASLRHNSLRETSLHQSRLYEDAGLCRPLALRPMLPRLTPRSARPVAPAAAPATYAPAQTAQARTPQPVRQASQNYNWTTPPNTTRILRHAVAGEGIAQGEAVPPSVIGADAVIRDRAATEMGIVRADGDEHSFCGFTARALALWNSLGWNVVVDERYPFRTVEPEQPLVRARRAVARSTRLVRPRAWRGGRRGPCGFVSRRARASRPRRHGRRARESRELLSAALGAPRDGHPPRDDSTRSVARALASGRGALSGRPPPGTHVPRGARRGARRARRHVSQGRKVHRVDRPRGVDRARIFAGSAFGSAGDAPRPPGDPPRVPGRGGLFPSAPARGSKRGHLGRRNGARQNTANNRAHLRRARGREVGRTCAGRRADNSRRRLVTRNRQVCSSSPKWPTRAGRWDRCRCLRSPGRHPHRRLSSRLCRTASRPLAADRTVASARSRPH